MLHIYTFIHFLYTHFIPDVCVCVFSFSRSCLNNASECSSVCHFCIIFIFQRIRTACVLISLLNLCSHAINSKVSILFENEHHILCSVHKFYGKSSYKNVFETGVDISHFEKASIDVVWGVHNLSVFQALFRHSM